MENLKLTRIDAQNASDEWGFNCGPAAACAVLGMTPDAIRPHLGDFEVKRYTNPTLMASILHSTGSTFCRKFESPRYCEDWETGGVWPVYGLVRIQWGGQWTRHGVPMAARYRHTHWVASRARPINSLVSHEIFDINAIQFGGWLSFREWSNDLTPWLIRQCEPKSDGTWWPTHCWEIGGL